MATFYPHPVSLLWATRANPILLNSRAEGPEALLPPGSCRIRPVRCRRFYWLSVLIDFAYSLSERLSAKPLIADDNIENAVEDEFLLDRAVLLFNINIICVDGIVT